MDIFERELAGEMISTDDPEYDKILSIILETMDLCRELNSGVHSKEENLEYLEKIIGSEVDESVFFMPPFYVDYGKNITIGKGVVIQQLCTFMDRGGITLEALLNFFSVNNHSSNSLINFTFLIWFSLTFFSHFFKSVIVHISILYIYQLILWRILLLWELMILIYLY